MGWAAGGQGVESTPGRTSAHGDVPLPLSHEGNLQQPKACNIVLFKQHRRVLQQSSFRQMEILQDAKIFLSFYFPGPSLIFLRIQEGVT